MTELDIALIVAFDKRFAIGKNGKIPWHIPEDLAHFKETTTGHVVVMGRKTWESIGSKCLSNRINIVISSTLEGDGAIFVKNDADAFALLKTMYSEHRIFVIGGARLYRTFMPHANTIYATHVDMIIEGADTFFPIDHEFSQFKMVSHFHPMNTKSCKVVVYRKSGGVHQEYKYINLMHNVFKDGEQRPDRTGVGTYSIFGPQLTFDIEHELPLLTTKFVGWKSIAKELLFFLKGQTDSKLLESQGVNIWKANTSREFLNARGLSDYQVGDMGPMYGWVWRHIGAEYKGCDVSYSGQGVDQLSTLVNGLRNDPFSRRHLITTYCPLYTDKGVLAPCHGICVQMYVGKSVHGKHHLSCHVYLRSNDVFLGQPYNIASYAMFTHIIAKMVNMVPKKLILSIGDCHLYNTHVSQYKEQACRTPLPFPMIRVADAVASKTFDELSLDDIDVVGYISHPAIKAAMAV